MSHTCHAIGCEAMVPPHLLMCLKHWKMVPKEAQRAVWRTYRPGQCDDRRPSKEWVFAARTAIAAVARKEGYDIPEDIRETMALAGIVVPPDYLEVEGARGGPLMGVDDQGRPVEVFL